MAWLYVFCCLKTRTALPVGDVVVAGTVAVVRPEAGVVAAHSKSLQGQPVGQFSLVSDYIYFR